MKKTKVILAACIVGMSFLVTENSSIHSVNANEVVNSNDSSQTSNIVISSEKISPYVIEFVTQQETNNIASYARSLSSHNDENYTTVRFDFSQAEFYDDNGNLLDKDTIMETIRPEKLLARSAGTSGGTWSSGSGYSVCKGMLVSGNAGLVGLQATYYVDFQKVQGGYDRLDRAYGATVNGAGSWAFLANGVFRASEAPGASAYGGIKGQWTVSPGLGLPSGTSTKHLYFRVGNDTFWLDTNF
ncbi:hypothetical protein ACR9F9_01155 [Streptococcus dysgalactiae subsp. equisimilis]|uniref:hypothetical protein n=1 Tax=Streptococcus dysgalactiae TaxID=1334 RepID=UPI003FD7B3D4